MAIDKNNKLTPVEWEIMDAVWKIGDSPSVRDVVDHAFPNGEKAYTTVQTIVKTLEKKGFLTSRKIGMVNFYTPVKSREEMVQAETNNLVARIFHGSVPAMANFLIDSQDLSLEEINQIKGLLAEKESELKKNPK
jgi:BlaI family transcriptional regulator, penicillinase repressor